MEFEKKVPDWENVGAEPDAQLKKDGFKAGYKPPAAYFNWFFNRISEAAKELQEKAGDEIDNKLDADGGDISDTVITSAEESTAEYPVPAAGDSTKVFLGKTRKFFADIRNWMTGVCLLGQIVNNCVTDNAKLPLSAAQGKALMDLYNVLNTNRLKIKICTYSVPCYVKQDGTLPYRSDGIDLSKKADYPTGTVLIVPLAAYYLQKHAVMAITSNTWLNVSGDNLTYNCSVAYFYI